MINEISAVISTITLGLGLGASIVGNNPEVNEAGFDVQSEIMDAGRGGDTESHSSDDNIVDYFIGSIFGSGGNDNDSESQSDYHYEDGLSTYSGTDERFRVDTSIDYSDYDSDSEISSDSNSGDSWW